MKKILLLLLTLTLIAVPSTMGYFMGGHTYNTKSCIDCHSREGIDITLGTTMTNLSCINCHPFDTNSDLTENGHSATNNMCNDCHIYTDNQFISKSDSHQDLYQAAIDDDSRAYANEACFFCHSDAKKSIDFYRPEFIEFEIEDLDGYWIVRNFNEGTEKNYNIVLNRNNGLHSFLSGEDTGCIECHTDITDAINIGGHYPSNIDNGPHQTTTTTCAQCHDHRYQGTRNQHVSKSITCVSCHSSHTLGVNILDSISGYPAEYEGNICLGCHNNAVPYTPLINNITKFKVFLEPSSVVIIT